MNLLYLDVKESCDIPLFDGYVLRVRDTRTCMMDHGDVEKPDPEDCYLLMIYKEDGWISLPANVSVPWVYDGCVMMDSCGCWIKYPKGDAISRTAPGALLPCYAECLDRTHPMHSILHEHGALPVPPNFFVQWSTTSLQFRFLSSSSIWQYRYVQFAWSNNLESYGMLPRLRSLFTPLLWVHHSRCVTKLTLLLNDILPRDLLEMVTSYT